VTGGQARGAPHGAALRSYGVPAQVLLLRGRCSTRRSEPADSGGRRTSRLGRRSPPLVLTRPSGAATCAGSSFAYQQPIVAQASGMCSAGHVSTRGGDRACQKLLSHSKHAPGLRPSSAAVPGGATCHSPALTLKLAATCYSPALALKLGQPQYEALLPRPV
jgi:hypothetical protein